MTELSVLHIDDGLGWRGGQHQVALLAEGLKYRGIRQWAMVREGQPLEIRLKEIGVDTLDCPAIREWNPFSIRPVINVVREMSPAIIHAHTAHAHGMGVAISKKLCGTTTSPKLVSTRRVDFPVGQSWFSRRKYLYAEQTYIAISEAVKAELLKCGIAKDRIHLVHSGVPPIGEAAIAREEARAKFGIAPKEIAIVSVGALVDHKDQRQLVDAAPIVLSEIPEARFWILGEGELRPELERLIEANELRDRFHLPGHVENARALLCGFDFYAATSKKEGLGTAVLDAVNAGLPIIASGGGGIAEIIPDESCGWTIEAEDHAGLANRIIEAIKSPASDRNRRVNAARDRVGKLFTADAMVEGTLNVYQRIINAPSSVR